MPTLTNTVENPGGSAISGVEVKTDLHEGLYRTSDDHTLLGPGPTVTVNSTGTWSLTLEANENFTPSGTYWAIEEWTTLANGERLCKNYAVQMPVAAGTYSVHDIAVSAPAPGAVPTSLNLSSLNVGGFPVPMAPPVSRGHSWRTPSFFELLQAGWSAGGGGLSSSNLNDTTDFVRGTQSAKVTTNGTGVQTFLRRFGFGALNLTDKGVRVILKVDDVTHLNRLEFVIGSSSLANFFKWTLHTHSAVNPNWVRSGEWVVLTFSWADVASASGTYSIGANGTPSTKTGFTDLQLNVFDDGVAGVTCHLQAVEVIPDINPIFADGVVSIVVDDSWQSFYDLAKPTMDGFGYRGTQYVISDYVGTANKLTMAELHSLQDHSGWEIAGHAYTNAAHGQTNGYADLTSSAVDAELRNLRSWLVSNGFNGDSFAYPKGHFGVTTDSVSIEGLVARYFSSGRSIISELAETIAPPMRYRLRAKTGISEAAGNTPASLVATGGPLDRCQIQGSWLILVFHQVTAGAPGASDQGIYSGRSRSKASGGRRGGYVKLCVYRARAVRASDEVTGATSEGLGLHARPWRHADP